MRTSLTLTITIFAAAILTPHLSARGPETAPQDTPTTPTTQAAPATPADPFAYVLGLDIGKSLKELDTELDLPSLMRGLADSLGGNKPAFETARIEQIKQEAFARLQQKHMAKLQQQAEANKTQEQAFLAKNKDKEGVITTQSGLQYEIIKQGDGAKPKPDDHVTVHYKGTLLDGTVFDNSRERGSPTTFKVNGVIPGWTEASQLMGVGDSYRLYIPAELAYGPRGAGPRIGPNATLVFEVELLSIGDSTEPE